MFAKLKHQPEKSPNERLLEALDLNSSDLEFNRVGEISPLQKERLTYAFWTNVFFAGCLFLILVALLTSAFISPLPAQNRLSYPITWGLIIATTVGLCSAVMYTRRRYDIIVSSHAVAFSGRVRKYVSSQVGKNRSPSLLIVIDYKAEKERIFEVLDNSFNAYIEGQTYILYFPSCDPKKIIAAEHIAADAMRK